VEMVVTWLGHSAVMLEVDGVRLVADPVYDNVGRTGLVRRIGGRLQDGPPWCPDLVVLSHMHHDHTDLPTLKRLENAALVAPPGGGEWLSDRGFDVIGEPRPGQTVGAHGLTVTAVPANHEGNRRGGPHADAVGHLVSAGHHTVWLAGDTDLYDQMIELPEMSPTGAIDLAMVPVWGWGPNIGPGHLDPIRAAEAVDRVGARRAVPVHWGTLHPPFYRRFMTHQLTRPGPELAEEVARRAIDCQVDVLPVGSSVTLS
jgi:L-ascorbate metabolism protein UlaG (beta-lactamase superfamily)